MKTVYLYFGALMLLVLQSCSTISATSDYDKNADFSAIKSFSIHEEGFKNLKVNDIDKSRIREALVQHLTAKGLTQTSSQGDVIVNVSAYNKDNVDVNYNSYGWGMGWGYGGFGMSWGTSSPSVNQYKVGSLVVDIVDSKKNTLIWQGIANGIRVEKLDKKQELIDEAMQKVMAKFPPKL